MSLLVDSLVEKPKGKTKANKEVETLHDLMKNNMKEGETRCSTKFMSHYLVVKALNIPIINDGSFVKEQSNWGPGFYLATKSVFIETSDTNNLYLKKINLNNPLIKSATLKYLRNISDSRLNFILDEIEKDFSSFWFTKGNKELLKEVAPELLKAITDIVNPDIVYFLNVIPNYVKDSYDKNKYKAITSSELEEHNISIPCFKPDKTKNNEQEKYYLLNNTDNIDNDLKRTPIRVLRLKSYYMEKIGEVLDNELLELKDDKAYGIFNSKNSFIVNIAKSENVATKRVNYSFSLSRTITNLSDVESKLLQWDLRARILGDQSEENINKILESSGYNNSLAKNIIEDSTDNYISFDPQNNQSEIISEGSMNTFSNSTEEELI